MNTPAVAISPLMPPPSPKNGKETVLHFDEVTRNFSCGDLETFSAYDG
jgi:hypothetical protein